MNYIVTNVSTGASIAALKGFIVPRRGFVFNMYCDTVTDFLETNKYVKGVLGLHFKQAGEVFWSFVP